MSSRVLLFICQRYLSNILDIDISKVNAKLSEGFISLENVKISNSLFRSFNFPYFEMIRGFVGNLKISFTYPKFYEKQISISVKKVFMHFRQVYSGDTKSEKEKQLLEDKKNLKLLNFEEIIKEISKENSSDYKERLLNNFTLNIEDVFIKYDDAVSYEEKPYSLGFYLQKLSLGAPKGKIFGLSSSSINFLLKEMRISNMTIFFDKLEQKEDLNYMSLVNEKINKKTPDITKKNIGSEMLDFYLYCVTEIETYFKKKGSDDGYYADHGGHDIVLDNFNFNLKLLYNLGYMKRRGQILNIDIEFEDIKLSLSLSQIEIINKTLRYIKKENIYHSKIQEEVYRKSVHKELIIEYVNEYIKLQEQKEQIQAKSFNTPKEIQVLEADLSYEQIMHIRRAALIKMNFSKQIDELLKQIQSDNGKISNGGGGGKKDEGLFESKKKDDLEKLESLKKERNQLMDKELEQIPQLGEEKVQLIQKKENKVSENNGAVPGEKKEEEFYKKYGPLYDDVESDFVFYSYGIKISKFNFDLTRANDINSNIFNFNFQGFDFEYQKRKVGMKIGFKLGDISFSPNKIPNKNCPEMIFCKNPFGKRTKGNIISFNYEHKPGMINSLDSDRKIEIESDKRLYIVFSPNKYLEIYKEILDVIINSGSSNWLRIKSFADNFFKEKIKYGLFSFLLNNNTEINNHQRINFNINIKLLCPNIIFPRNLYDNKFSNVYYLSFGSLNLYTTKLQNVIPPDAKNERKEEILYEIFGLVIDKVYFKYCPTYSIEREDDCYSEYIINEITLTSTIKTIIETKNVHNDNFIIKAELYKLKLDLIDTRLIDLVNDFSKMYFDSIVKYSQISNSDQRQDTDNNINQEIGNDFEEDENEIEKNKEDDKSEKTNLLQLTNNASLSEVNDLFNNNDNDNQLLSNKNLSKSIKDFKNNISMDFVINELEINIYKSLKEEEKDKFKLSKERQNGESKFFIIFKVENINYILRQKINGMIRQDLDIYGIVLEDIEMGIKHGRETPVNVICKPFQKLIYCDSNEKNFKFNYVINPISHKTKLDLSIGNINVIFNFKSFVRLFAFYRLLLDLRNVFSKDKLKDIGKECKKFDEIKRKIGSKGINNGYFKSVGELFRGKTKAQLMQEANLFSNKFREELLKKTGLKTEDPEKHNEIVDFNGKTNISIKFNNVIIQVPLNEEKENSPVVCLYTDLVYKYRVVDERKIERQMQSKEIIRQNFTKLDKILNFMLSNMHITIMTTKKEEVVLNNFRVTFFYKSHIIPENKNIASTAELILEPILLSYSIDNFNLIDKYIQRVLSMLTEMKKVYEKGSDTLSKIYGNMESAESKIMEYALKKKKAKLMKKDKEQKMYNIASFNKYLTFSFSLDKFNLYFYKDSKEIKQKFFEVNLYLATLTYIFNNDPCDELNMANALVEIISSKNIPINQFNIQKMYNYLNFNVNFKISFFNNYLNSYEPLIEPAGLTVKLIQVAKFTRKKWNISVNDMININITPKCLMILNTFIDNVLYHNDENISNFDDKEHICIEFSNETGNKLIFTFDSDEDQKKFEIPTGGINKFSVLELQRLQQTKNFNVQLNLNKISFYLEGYEPVHGFDISKFKCSIFTTSITNSPEETIDICVRIQEINNIKCVKFSSCIRIENKTSYDDLTICFDKDQKIVKSNTILYLPLDWVNKENSKNGVVIKRNPREPDKDFLEYPNFYHLLYEKKIKKQKKKPDDNEEDYIDFSKKENPNYSPNGRIIEIAPDEFICVNLYFFQIKEKNKSEEQENSHKKPKALLRIVIAPPIQFDSQIPEIFPFSYINYNSAFKDYNNQIKNFEVLDIYTIDPREKYSLIKVKLNYYGITYSSHSINIYEANRDISLISEKGDKFNISIKMEEGSKLLNYDWNIFELVEKKTANISYRFTFYFEFIICNTLQNILYLIPINTTLNIQYCLNSQAITLLSTKSKEMHIKYRNKMSNPVRIDTIGLNGLLTWNLIQEKHSLNRPYLKDENTPPELSMSIKSSNYFPNSTIILLQNKYIMINKLGEIINVRRVNSKGQEMSKITLEPNEKSEVSSAESTTFQIGELGIRDNKSSKVALWSEVFDISKLSEYDIKLQIPTNEYQSYACKYKNVFSYDDLTHYIMIRVIIKTFDQGSIFIVLTFPEFYLLEINNKTKVPLELVVSQNELFKIQPNKNVPFSFNRTDQYDSDITCNVYNKKITFNFSKFQKKEYPITVGYDNKTVKKTLSVSISTTNSGHTRLFTISIRDRNDIVKDAFEKYLLKNDVKGRIIDIYLKGIGISLINDKLNEVLYLSLYKIDANIKNKIFKEKPLVKTYENYYLYIKNIQLDYNLNDTYKVILYPKYQQLPSNEENILKDKVNNYFPIVQAGLYKKTTLNLLTKESVTKYQNIDFVFQEFEIEIDEKMIVEIAYLCRLYYSILNVLSKYKNKNEEISKTVIEEVQFPGMESIRGGSNSQMNLIKYFFISGCKCDITFNFKNSETVQKRIGLKIINLFGEDLNLLRKSSIYFNELIFQNLYINATNLLLSVYHHIKDQFIRQIYFIILKENILENSIKEIDSISSGFLELLNLPREGFIYTAQSLSAHMGKDLLDLIKKIITKSYDSIVSLQGTMEVLHRQLKELPIKKQKNERFNDIRPNYLGLGGGSGSEKKIEMEKEFREKKIFGEKVDDKNNTVNELKGFFMNPYKTKSTEGVKIFGKKPIAQFIDSLMNPIFSRNVNSLSEKKNTSIKYNTGKLKTVRFRYPRVIYQEEPLSNYNLEIAEVRELLTRRNIFNYDRIFLCADIIKEKEPGKFLTVIVTDQQFILTDLIVEALVFNNKDVLKCEVFSYNKKYQLVFELKDDSGNKKIIRKKINLSESKLAFRVQDMYTQIIPNNFRLYNESYGGNIIQED